MADRTRDELQADLQRTIERKASIEAALAAQDAKDADDLEAFKKMSGTDRTQMFRNPHTRDRYRTFAQQWQDELERALIDKGGR
jgi:hypothetical protein